MLSLSTAPLSTVAAAGVYSIDGTAVPNGLFVSISGEAAANPYTGQGDDQHVSVDWNEDGGATASNANGDWETVLDINASGDSFASTSWSGSHTYPVAGSYTIFVRVHHAEPGGAESGSGQIDFAVELLPQCSDGVDNDEDGFEDFPADPGCTDEDDDSESPDPVTTGTLHIVKSLIKDNGGTAVAEDFSFQVDGGSATAFEADGQNDLTLPAGTYDVTEVATLGYTTSYDSCTDIELAAGGEATCTITNDDQQGTLIVKKVLINDNGGTAAVDDFSFHVNGGPSVSFEVDGQNDLPVNAALFDITESSPEGYTTDYDNCDDVAVANGETETCTITNDDIAPSLTLDKVTAYTHGGTAPESSWTLSADGGDAGTLSGPGAEGSTDVVSDETFQAGTYALSESAAPTGYINGESYSCVLNGGDAVSSNSITLGIGDSAVCTITNTDLPGTLIIQKTVINDNSGIATAGDFSFSVDGGESAAFNETDDDDDNPLTGENTVSVDAGDYTVAEDSAAGYSTTPGDDCTGTIANGETKTCTITNDDLPPGTGTLTIVANSTGGDGTFSFSVTGPTSTSTSVTTSGGVATSSDMVVEEGTSYGITASAPNWTFTGASCSDGSSTGGLDNVSGIVINPDDHVTCTFSGVKNAPEPEPTPEPTPEPETRSGGGGGGPGCSAGYAWSPSEGKCVPTGQVLGAATSTPALGVTCGLYMDQHLRQGSPKNNPGQVTRLQQFLAKHGYGSFAPTGFFGPLTFAAVQAFQQAYAEAILKPWNLSAPTGLVYLTTIRQLNLIECPDLMLPMPELVPWNQNPNAQ
jgi:hypothetical protein